MCVECVASENTEPSLALRIEFYDLVREFSAQIKPSTEVLEQYGENCVDSIKEPFIQVDEPELELYVRIRNCYDVLIDFTRYDLLTREYRNGTLQPFSETLEAAARLRDGLLDLGIYLSDQGLGVKDVDVLVRYMLDELGIVDLYRNLRKNNITLPDDKLRGTYAELLALLWLRSKGIKVDRSDTQQDRKGIDLRVKGTHRPIANRHGLKWVQVKSTSEPWPPTIHKSGYAIDVDPEIRKDLLLVHAPCRYTL